MRRNDTWQPLMFETPFDTKPINPSIATTPPLTCDIGDITQVLNRYRDDLLCPGELENLIEHQLLGHL